MTEKLKVFIVPILKNIFNAMENIEEWLWAQTVKENDNSASDDDGTVIFSAMGSAFCESWGT